MRTEGENEMRLAVKLLLTLLARPVPLRSLGLGEGEGGCVLLEALAGVAGAAT
jgi:hypothetical protein